MKKENDELKGKLAKLVKSEKDVLVQCCKSTKVLDDMLYNQLKQKGKNSIRYKESSKAFAHANTSK